MSTGTELASAYVQIIPSAQGMKAKLTEILGDEMPNGEESGKGWGASLINGIKTVIATAGIGEALKQSISEGAALEQSIGGIETLFKNSADTVIKNAEQAYRTAGLSANEYMENVTGFSASLLQGLGGDTEKAALIADMAMTDMSDNANKMGTDMGSIQNAYQGFAKQNYTMLDNLKLGYGGTKSEMERLLADAEKFSGVKYDINNLSDVYEAIHVIQGELDITGTTAKEAASTISGSGAAMKSAFKNVLGNLALGQDLQPSLNALKETAITFIGGNLLPAVGNVLKGLPAIVGTAFTSLSSALPQITAAATGLMGQLASSLQESLPTLIPAALHAVAAFASNLRSSAGKLVDSGLHLITTLAQGLIDNIPVMIETIPGIVTDIAGIINDNAPKLLEAGLNLIVNLGKGLIKAIPTLVKNIPQIVKAIFAVWQAVNWLDLGKNVITAIKNGINALQTQVPTALKNIGQKALEFFRGIDWAGIGRTVINLIKNGVQALFTAIPNLLKSIGQNGVNLFKSINWGSLGQAVINMIKGGIQSLFSAIPNLLKSIGQSAFNFFKGINWSGLGQAVINLIKNGLSALGSGIASLLKSIGSNALSAFKNINWASVGRAVINLIKSAISGTASGVVSALRSAGSNAMSAFKGLSWSSVGQNITSGIAGGIRSGASAIKSAASTAASNALSAAKRLLGIHSPSRVFRDQVGKNIALGMADGILGNAGAVSSAMDTLNQVPAASTVKAGIMATRSAPGVLPANADSYRNISQPIVVQLKMDGSVITQAVVRDLKDQTRRGMDPLRGII